MKNILNNYLGFLAFISLILLFNCGKEACESPCSESNFSINELKIDRKVLIIGIDGFRSDVLQDSIAPFLFGLSSDNQTFFNGQHKTEEITSSGPNWTSIVTGVSTSKHNVTNNNFSNNQLDKYPHFFKYIELAAPSLQTVSICHWIPISGFLSKNYADYNPIQSFTDQEVYQHANSIINKVDSVEGDVIFLHFDDLDHEGHAHGYSRNIPEYRQVVSNTDQYVEDLMNSIDQRRLLGEDWIVFIISDHGGEGTDHSGQPDNPNVNQTIFFVQHPSLAFKTGSESTQVDLVPTALDFLGIENAAFSCNMDGISLLE